MAPDAGLAAAGLAPPRDLVRTVPRGSDVVDDGVEQEVGDAGNEIEEEVDGTDRDDDS